MTMAHHGGKNTICLNMIVKNESHIIRETLESMKKYIDYWVICDTGSTDNTKELIIEYFKKEGIPGDLIEEPWADHFGYNRTVALQACKGKADYIWIIDADDVVRGNLILPDVMTCNSYGLTYGSGFTYMRIQIFSNKLEWEYVCVRHEFARCTNKDVKITSMWIKSDYHIASRRLGARSMDPDKYLNDALAMERCISTEPEFETRYKFYIGQSYLDYGDYEKAIYWYNERIKKKDFYEEVYYSYYRIAVAMKCRGDDWEKIEEVYMKAWKYLPSRAEPLYEIAKHYREFDNFEKSYKYAKLGSTISFPSNQTLFISKEIYDWKIFDELGLTAYYIGKYQESVDAYKKALLSGLVPEHHIERIKENIKFSLEKNIITNTEEKKIIVFYVGYSKFTKEHVYGSELALLSLAKELLPRYNIYVVGSYCSDKVEDRITFIPSKKFKIFQHLNNIEILIVSRYVHYFIDFKITAKQTYIWVHDTTFHYAWDVGKLPEDGKYLVGNIINYINGIVVLSEWHKTIFLKKYKYPQDKVFIIGNGLNDMYYDSNKNKTKGRFIYTSDPSRGLRELIDYFHTIHSEFPYVELYVYRGKNSFNNNKCKDLIDIMDKYDYIHYKGKLSQKELATEFIKSDIWLYPSSFTETYCMSGLEALRGGCYCISNDLAALKDTIGNRGILIKGNIKNNNGSINIKTKELFLTEVRIALINDEHKKIIQEKAVIWAKEQNWTNRANEWIYVFNNIDINDQWVCISGSDNYGGDLVYVPDKSIKEMKEMASMMDNCVGFNSYGYFKKNISTPKNWIHISDIKLYIKKDIYNQFEKNKLSDYVKDIYNQFEKNKLPDYVKDISYDDIENNKTLPTIYIINLPYRTDRKNNIIKRMKKYNLEYKFIEAETKDSSLVKYYSWNGSNLNNIEKSYDRLGEFGCFASHLKALKLFIDCGDEYGIIVEDDITLRDSFNNMLESIMKYMPDKTPLVMLCVSNREPYIEWDKKYGKPKDNHINLIKINGAKCWGTLGYIISRDYALKAINDYDKPFYLIDNNRFRVKNKVTSELITMNSKGYYTYPPLVLEELSTSDINDKNPEHHKNLFKWCIFENYN